MDLLIHRAENSGGKEAWMLRWWRPEAFRSAGSGAGDVGGLSPSLSSGGGHQLPEATGAEDSHLLDGRCQLQEVLVAGDECLDRGMPGLAEHGNVVRIAHLDWRRSASGTHDAGLPSDETNDRLDPPLGQADLAGQDPLELTKDRLGDAPLVLGQDGADDVRAQSSSGEGGHEDVGVEEDLHDTALNTSSSVRSPFASAKGATRSRSCSKSSMASCLRRASRATWLWVRRESRATRASIRAVSRSMRMVSVSFM